MMVGWGGNLLEAEECAEEKQRETERGRGRRKTQRVVEGAERLGHKESGVGAYWSELQNRCTRPEQRERRGRACIP